jgi:hypothetical protein
MATIDEARLGLWLVAETVLFSTGIVTGRSLVVISSAPRDLKHQWVGGGRLLTHSVELGSISHHQFPAGCPRL